MFESWPKSVPMNARKARLYVRASSPIIEIFGKAPYTCTFEDKDFGYATPFKEKEVASTADGKPGAKKDIVDRDYSRTISTLGLALDDQSFSCIIP